MWRVIGKSITGAAHLRQQVPNQDRIKWYPDEQKGDQVILTVSDGHGSAKSFLSQKGADLAVKIAMKILKQYGTSIDPDKNLSALNRIAKEHLPQDIVYRWRKEVEHDWMVNPYFRSEANRLKYNEGDYAKQAVDKNPYLAYGATLLGVLITNQFVLCIQLGDGDILLISEKGEVNRPFPVDERLFGNETTSLCSENAWLDVNIHFQPLQNNLPELILVSTDGYSNSFIDESSFLKVGKDIWEMKMEFGITSIENQLVDWLYEASSSGSGDDITMGIIFRE